MKKIDLVQQVATEGADLKRKIINAIAEDDTQSQVTAVAVTQLFADLNELVQSAKVKGDSDNVEHEKIQHQCPHCQADLTADSLAGISTPADLNQRPVTTSFW